MKVKEVLDVLEDIMTIIVSLVALSGTWIAYERGFFHKVEHLVNHYHTVVEMKEAEIAKDHTAATKDASRFIENMHEDF